MTIKITEDQKRAVITLNTMLTSGEIATEHLDCVCGSNQFTAVNEIDRIGIVNKVVMCKNCGLIQANPRMTYQEITKFYSSDLYRRLQDSVSFLKRAEERIREKKGFGIRDSLEPYLNTGARKSILEIGAGGGWNSVHFANDDADWLGVDMSTELVKFGQDKGFNIIKGSFDEIEAMKKKFDIIILNHVIEHFTRLYQDLDRVRTLLADDGILYIGVPNILNYGFGQFQLAHNFYFTPSTLRNHMGVAGFKLIESGEVEEIHMFGIFVKSPPNTTNLHPDNGNYAIMRKKIDKYNLREKFKSIVRPLGILPLAKKVRDTLYS